MDTEFSQEEIVEFLEKGKGGILIKSLNWWGPARSRVLAFAAMWEGIFSFREFCQWSLPSSAVGRSKLTDRYDKFLYEESKREYPGYPDDRVSLFGHKFGGPNYREVIGLVNEVIVLDQYHANKFIKKDSIVIDAGANIGTFSIFAARMAPEGQIYAFEPVKKTFEELKKNAEYYPQIMRENIGLGDVVSQKNIFVNPKSTGGSVVEDSPYCHVTPSGGQSKELVNITTIDTFVYEKKIPHVDFIKMDVEGYEAKILEGAKETIKKYKPVIAMSAYHNASDKNDLPRLLKSICPDYICGLYRESEEDLICYPRV
jgi:FkbM family methyltransferase